LSDEFKIGTQWPMRGFHEAVIRAEENRARLETWRSISCLSRVDGHRNNLVRTITSHNAWCKDAIVFFQVRKHAG